MAALKVVTGFVPIPGHPRSEKEYHDLGCTLVSGLIQGGYELHVGACGLATCALSDFITPSMHVKAGDNPAKNTWAYHAVQHQKFMFLYEAYQNTIEHPDAYVWIDYGILHVPGVTMDVICNYLNHVRDGDTIDIPGCWTTEEAAAVLPSDFPVWRFCGGLIKVPSSLIPKFCVQSIVTAAAYLKINQAVEWEVNTLARLEALEILPIRWYQADHNQTMFTGAP